MIRRYFVRSQTKPLPPATAAELPSFDLQGGRPVELRLDGTAKQALETGRTRLLVAAVSFALAFSLIGWRLIDLGLMTDRHEPSIARDLSSGGLETGRADIVDRNGIVLATTLPTASLYANPRHVRDPEAAAAQLATVLPQASAAQLGAKLASERSFVWLQRNLTPRQHDAVNRLGIPGLYFQRERRRFYPHGALTPHVVGFTGVDNQGLAGIEQSFDDVLRASVKPLPLSLDIRIQHILSEELARSIDTFSAIGGAGVVMDVTTGEIVAMASLPSYDPAKPAAAAAEARFNRASLGAYEMGSIFKIFTTAMALNEGVVTLRDGYDTRQPIRISRFTIRDFKPKNRWLSIPEIFMYSSNIGTVHMAMDAGTPAQQTFLKRLGLLQPANIELPEVGQPIVPSPWREINTMTISYGYGLAVSPLQVAGAVASLVNGGTAVRPTLLKRDPAKVAKGPRIISEETSETIRRLMRLVVAKGSGRKANAEGYLVGGKTGTADKLAGRRYARNARISSFVAGFPMDKPRYVVFVTIDEPKPTKETHGYATGGWVAAPAVNNIVTRVAPLVGIAPRDNGNAMIEQLLVEINKSAEGRQLASN
ncbi:penicillin-binding protein 2 [Pelagibius litoralis]|uniref:Penicillin-binding protein 2 n=1 Tax=Pelagibius litoralis TaxID=374515 RepID=A0A967C4P6_9PROT|nr:penicillin-binding protein 2 [Pelagibius litoralis]NIA68619.1 penicillin-binding protein 2 [Pelagibius litoralis]